MTKLQCSAFGTGTIYCIGIVMAIDLLSQSSSCFWDGRREHGKATEIINIWIMQDEDKGMSTFYISCAIYIFFLWNVSWGNFWDTQCFIEWQNSPWLSLMGEIPLSGKNKQSCNRNITGGIFWKEVANPMK